MVAATLSPRSQQRVRIFDAYRGRGHKNNNLWLLYSVKTDRDWVLSNDRRLVHWIYHLEINPQVKSFELLAESDKLSKRVDDVEECDAEVLLIDGKIERHRIFAGEITELNTSTEYELSSIKVFTDENLRPHVKTCIRWLKALGYAAVIRGQTHTPVQVALLSHLQNFREGTLADLSNDLSDYDSAIIFGLLVRLAVQGVVELDLSNIGFNSSTPWYWKERDVHVVP